MRIVALLFAVSLSAVATTPLAAQPAPRYDRFDVFFNAAAERTPFPIRLSRDSCSSARMCEYVGPRGITADTVAPSDAPSPASVLIRFPLGRERGDRDAAEGLEVVLLALAPKMSAADRSAFGLYLLRELKADGTRAEGRFAGRAVVLRYDRGEQWRIVIERPDR